MARGETLAEVLAPERLVDLMQPLGPATLLWPGSPELRAKAVAAHEAGGGYSRALSLSAEVEELEAAAGRIPAASTGSRRGAPGSS